MCFYVAVELLHFGSILIARQFYHFAVRFCPRSLWAVLRLRFPSTRVDPVTQRDVDDLVWVKMEGEGGA